MTDTNKTEAPERIWAWPFKDWFRGGCSTHRVRVAGAKDIEYVRADLFLAPSATVDKTELTTRDVENLTGVSKATVSRIRNGADFSVSTARKLLPALRECPCCRSDLSRPAPVTVKPLDWTYDDDGDATAQSPFGPYTAYQAQGYGVLCMVDGHDDEWAEYPADDYGFEDVSQAIEECERDYLSRMTPYVTPSPQLTEQEKQADLEAETARMSPEALDGPQDVAQAARVLLDAHEEASKKPVAERTALEIDLACMGRNRLKRISNRGQGDD